MFLHCLKLRNILSFREPEPLRLQPLTLFIGPNASGKSNLIDSIELLSALPTSLQHFVNRRGGTDAWIWKGARRTEDAAARLTCDFELEGDRLVYEVAFDSVERVLVIQKDALAAADDPNQSHPFLMRFTGKGYVGALEGKPTMPS